MVSSRQRYSSRLKVFKSIFILFSIFSVNTSSMVIDNLNDVRANWSAISDQVMGGISVVNFYEMEEDGQKFYRLEGNVSTENNGGFIQSRVGLNIKAKDFNGIRIKVRGNNNEYFVHLRAPRMLPWNYYYAEFYASSDWEIIDIPLSSFKYSRNQNDNLNSRVIRSIGIVAYGKDFSAQLDLANIELY